MASNLSTIGFVFTDHDAFRASMLACASAADTRLACSCGVYGIWQSRTGAQIWFHLSRSDDGSVEILGLTPFFEGKSEISVNVTNAIQLPDENPFEGTFHGWVSPNPQAEANFGLVFEAVDFAARDAGPLPIRRRVRLSAFARELAAYPSPADFRAAHREAETIKLAEKAFLPAGLIAMADEGNRITEMPTAAAVLTGHVRECCLLRNEVSGRDFHWLLVETLEMTIDVVADPDIVKGDVVEGSTIQTTAVLFGRFLD